MMLFLLFCSSSASSSCLYLCICSLFSSIALLLQDLLLFCLPPFILFLVFSVSSSCTAHCLTLPFLLIPRLYQSLDARSSSGCW
jgi:hypothetical protein